MLLQTALFDALRRDLGDCQSDLVHRKLELTQANTRSFDRLFFRNAADRLLHVVDAAHADRFRMLFRPVLRNLRRDLAD